MSSYRLAATVVGSTATMLYITARPEWYDRNGYHLLFMPKDTYVGVNLERIVFSKTRANIYNGDYVYHRKIEYFWKTGILECTSQSRYDPVKSFSMDMSAGDYIEHHKKISKESMRE